MLGIIFKCFFTGRLHVLSTTIYVLMGWIAVVAIRPLLQVLPWPGFLWLPAGGPLYTLGVAFSAWRRRYSHSIASWCSRAVSAISLRLLVRLVPSGLSGCFGTGGMNRCTSFHTAVSGALLGVLDLHRRG